MKINLDEHGILEIRGDRHHYSILLNREYLKDLKEQIEEYLEDV